MANNIQTLQEQMQQERKDHYEDCENIRAKIFDECAQESLAEKQKLSKAHEAELKHIRESVQAEANAKV